MNVIVYGRYRIREKIESDTIDPESESLENAIFNTNTYTKESVISGGYLIDKIQKLLNDEYINYFETDENSIEIDIFNFNTGESDTHYIEILEELNNENFY